MTQASLRVALVNMPFGSTRYPSIQLGLLQAILKQRGIEATTYYFNLEFGARLGWDIYEQLCEQRSHLMGEWLFSRAALGENAPDDGHYLAIYGGDVRPVCEKLGRDDAWLQNLREEMAPEFIRECLDAVDWAAYDVVGFGSAFEQNCAALALAFRLKERHPHLITVFGGANFEDEMGVEYVRGLPAIDYAVIGEGDEVFPALLQRLASGEEVLGIPGVARRLPDCSVSYAGRAATVRNLDALPEPDYEEYFAAAAALHLPGNVQGREIQLPFETARGCWWGAKHHCTFCGLNGLGMSYRSKSPARVLAGIDELAQRYHVYTLAAVDNILDQRYITEVFEPLAASRRDYNFFYEVKANLTAAQLGALACGGVRRLQPGIESLSSRALKLMNKGTTGIQNVRLLKWAAYYGISIGWNVLVGFPGERPEDYTEQLRTMKLIPHLQPPGGFGRIWLERYSPNFSEAEARGIRNVRPERAYACIYPPHLDKERIAYFFEYDAPDTVPFEQHQPLQEYLHWWQEAWRAPRLPHLAYQRGSGRLTVVDGRQPGDPRVYVFDEPAALAYEFCSPTVHGAARVLAHLRDACGIDTDLDAVHSDLDAFTAMGLMLEEDGHYLSLALPVNPNW
jgi:ribosomal peptide maturation radical SAM protein 1